MIKVENIAAWGFEHAIRGMRNPLNSWDKSDSKLSWVLVESEYHAIYTIGENDLKLMQKLYKAGSEHRKYLRQIFVSMDITAPLYWWAEMDTYKVGVTRNSCSKMHKLMARPFEMSDFSFDKLIGYRNEVKQFVPEVTEDMEWEEEWLPYDEEYDVSNYGRVRHKYGNHFKIIGGSKHKDYIFVTIKGKQVPIHIMVCKLFNKKGYKDGYVVNHKDGNKYNNFSDNLEWCTQSDNVKHSYENDFQPRGLTTYKGKFTEEERKKIKYLCDKCGKSRREVAKMYDVSHTCISDIVNDKYKYADTINIYEEFARPIIDTLNELRDSFLNEENYDCKKEIWYSIIQLLPESYNQRSTVTMNYENVVNIIHQRENHKLDEWNVFCDTMLEKLPYLKEIMEYDKTN